MGAIFSYAILSGLVMLVCYFPYRFFMSDKKQYGLNRLTIYIIYMLSLLAPLLVFKDQAIVGNVPDTFSSIAFSSQEIQSTGRGIERQKTIESVLILVYSLGVICVGIWYVVGLIRISLIIRKSHRIETATPTIRVTEDEDLPPFNWGSLIIMGKTIYKSKFISMIIAHEKAHIRHRHFLDLLIAQIMVTYQWFNPVAWMLRDELREIHEFQADEDVIKSGVNPVSYQHFLVRAAFGTKFNLPADFLNAGNIRKRIIMINNKNSSGFRRFTIIAILPAFIIGVMACNLSPVKTIVDQFQNTSLNYSFTAQTENTKNIEKESDNQISEARDQEEQMNGTFQEAEFIGGQEALMLFLMNTLKYPKEAENNHEEGKVIVAFDIASNGEVISRKIDKSLSKALDDEALRVCGKITKFKPAMRYGSPVASTLYLPIIYKLK